MCRTPNTWTDRREGGNSGLDVGTLTTVTLDVTFLKIFADATYVDVGPDIKIPKKYMYSYLFQKF